MTDYISRKVAIRAIIDKQRDHTTPWRLSYELGKKHAADEYVEVLKAVPAADVRPVVHGHYIGEYDGYADGNPVYDMWYCSECGCLFEDWDEKPTYNFCPNCGCAMENEK